jgi:hypothetical protein
MTIVLLEFGYRRVAHLESTLLRTVMTYSTIGRLQRWPPFAKGSLSGPGMEVTVVLAYEDLYRALAGDATIPGDRPVRPGSEFVRCRNKGELAHAMPLAKQASAFRKIWFSTRRLFSRSSEALHFRFLQSSGNPCPAPCAGQPSLLSYLQAVHLVGDILRAGPPADPDLHKHLLTRLIGITEIPEGAKALPRL